MFRLPFSFPGNGSVEKLSEAEPLTPKKIAAEDEDHGEEFHPAKQNREEKRLMKTIETLFGRDDEQLKCDDQAGSCSGIAIQAVAAIARGRSEPVLGFVDDASERKILPELLAEIYISFGERLMPTLRKQE